MPGHHSFNDLRRFDSPARPAVVSNVVSAAFFYASERSQHSGQRTSGFFLAGDAVLWQPLLVRARKNYYGICHIWYEHRSTDAEFDQMLAALLATFGGRRAVSPILGVPALTLEHWRTRKRKPSAGARRLVWLVWALVFKPHSLATVFDLITWGRYAPNSRRSGRQADTDAAEP